MTTNTQPLFYVADANRSTPWVFKTEGEAEDCAKRVHGMILPESQIDPEWREADRVRLYGETV